MIIKWDYLLGVYISSSYHQAKSQQSVTPADQWKWKQVRKKKTVLGQVIIKNNFRDNFHQLLETETTLS